VAGLIPPHVLEQIRAANDIVDVIGSYLPLKRAGANFVALCPFHKEKSPSFNVNPQRQIFHCFGCHKGGDVFTFVREYENIAFVDAVRRLAERASIPLEFENTPAAQEARHIKDILWNIHEQITQRWQSALANDAGGQIARDYLAGRGVSEEAVNLFRLGYAPELWDDTVNWAKSKGHDLAVMEQAGLIIRKEGSDRYYDRFRGRLIFPICDEQGRVIAFSGRVLSGDEKTAKYVNSPETPIFTKGKVFFGLDKSKRALLEADSAVVCEGQLDLIACFMAGVQNIVAPQGTALTPDHERILKRYVEEVVLCFDADNAGQNAAIRSLDPLLAAGLSIRVASIPDGKDPDGFIKAQGGTAFGEVLKKAEGFFDWYLKRLCATNDVQTDKGRIAVLREFGEALARTGNAVLVDTYAQKAALRLGVATEAVRAEFRKSRAPQTREPVHDEAADQSPGEPPSVQEKQLIRILVIAPEHVQFAAGRLDREWIVHPVVKRIVQRLTDSAISGVALTPTIFPEFHDDAAAQTLLSEVLAESHAVPQPEKQLVDVLTHLRNDFISAELLKLTRRLSHPEASESERLQLLHRQKELRTLKQTPLAIGDAARNVA
jgi:DNA primase